MPAMPREEVGNFLTCCKFRIPAGWLREEGSCSASARLNEGGTAVQKLCEDVLSCAPTSPRFPRALASAMLVAGKADSK